MLIHPWDAALDSAEWQDWLASTGKFGMLALLLLPDVGDPSWRFTQCPRGPTSSVGRLPGTIPARTRRLCQRPALGHV